LAELRGFFPDFWRWLAIEAESRPVSLPGRRDSGINAFVSARMDWIVILDESAFLKIIVSATNSCSIRGR